MVDELKEISRTMKQMLENCLPIFGLFAREPQECESLDNFFFVFPFLFQLVHFLLFSVEYICIQADSDRCHYAVAVFAILSLTLSQTDATLHATSCNTVALNMLRLFDHPVAACWEVSGHVAWMSPQQSCCVICLFDHPRLQPVAITSNAVA